MPVQMLILVAALSLLGGAVATDASAGSPTITIPSDDSGGGSPTAR